MELDNKILKRFIKDFSLPIQLIQMPYFEYYISLYDKVYNSKEKWKLFTDTLNKLGGTEQFYAENKKVQDSIIHAISQTEIYKKFNYDRLDEYNVKLNISKNNVFNNQNDGKLFISIDLKKANFYSLKYYDNNLVLNTENYNQLISKFTNLEYIKQSKYIRQIIFGNLNPKKQQKIQKYIMSKLLNVMLKYFDKNKILNVSHDEIVVMIDSINIDDKFYNEIYSYCNDLGIPINIELFKLKQLKPYKYFVKEIYNTNKIDFKCCPSIYMPQIYKYYFNDNMNKYDFYFLYENSVAKFVEPLNFKE